MRDEAYLRHTLMAILMEDHRPAQRRCLRCPVVFASPSPAFRLCPLCRTKNRHRGMPERQLAYGE